MSSLLAPGERLTGWREGLDGLIASVTRPAHVSPPASAGIPLTPLSEAPVAVLAVDEPEPEVLDGFAAMSTVPERPMIPLDLGDIPLVLPRADMTLLYGRGGIGKGRLTHSLIARVTEGGGDVVGAWAEDKPDEQVRARLEAAGADPAHVWNITRLGDGTRFKLSAAERHEGHISLLRAFMSRLADMGRDPRLIILDPVSALVGWGTIQTVAGARRFVEPVQDLADTTGAAVLGIGHPRKDGKLQGSEGLRDALRVIYEVSVDPINAAYRVITMEKGNDLASAADGLRFTITSGPEGRPRVEWVTRESMDAERAAWRDRLTATTRTPVAPLAGGMLDAPVRLARAGTWPASCMTSAGAPVPLGSHHPAEEAAKGACVAHAGEPLTWKRSATMPGTWIATSSRRDGYSVSAPL